MLYFYTIHHIINAKLTGYRWGVNWEIKMQENKTAGQQTAAALASNNFVRKDVSKLQSLSRSSTYNVMSTRHTNSKVSSRTNTAKIDAPIDTKLDLRKTPSPSELSRPSKNSFSSVDVATATSLSDKTVFKSAETSPEETAGLSKSSLIIKKRPIIRPTETTKPPNNKTTVKYALAAKPQIATLRQSAILHRVKVIQPVSTLENPTPYVNTQISTNLGSVAVSNDITLPIFNLQAMLNKNPLVPMLNLPNIGNVNNHLKKTIHTKKHLILIGVSVFAVILASIALLSIGNSKPKGGMLDSNVSIGGIDVSQQYPAEAKKNLQTASQKQQINIDVAGKSLQANAKDIGLTRDIDSALNQAEAGRKTIAQKAVLKDNKPLTISLKSSINQDTLNKFIAAKLGPDMVPANAELKTDDGNLTVVPGKNGIAIDSNKLSNQLSQTGLVPSIKVKAASSVVPPNISTEAAQAANAKAESLIAANYVVGNDAIGFKTIPHSQKVGWLAVSPAPDNNINVSINTEAAKKSFDGTITSFNKKAEDTTQVNIPGGSTIVLDQGTDGINIPTSEINTASTQFLSLLAGGQGGTIKINPNIVPAGVRALNGPTSGKMILVDVPNFKAYAIENGNIANQTLVSTGQKGGETPAGVFAIKSKIKSVTLKGCAPAFGCWTVPNVPNVMTFDSRGDALHGAYWHNSFGKANLSHGCVNLPLGFADWLFDWAEVGTPVVVVR